MARGRFDSMPDARSAAGSRPSRAVREAVVKADESRGYVEGRTTEIAAMLDDRRTAQRLKDSAKGMRPVSAPRHALPPPLPREEPSR